MSEEHDQGLVKPIECDAHSLPLIPLLDLYVVVPPSNIHLGGELGFFQFINDSQDKEEWVRILDCMFIEVPIVLARAKADILFLDKAEERGLRGLRFLKIS